MEHFEKLIEQCDEWIKAGRPHEVNKLLASLNNSRIPREWRGPLAKVCRRAGLLSLGLKILARVILNEKQAESPPTPTELAEYAVLLQRSGALNEAFDKLSRVDTRQVPEALLYRAFVQFARWEFRESIPHLREYLQSGLAPYTLAVGQINLAFALIETRQYAEALDLLEKISAPNSPQVQSNAHALRGQIYLQRSEFSSARAEFETARNLVPAAQTNDQLFALKWKLILEGLENKSREAFSELRELAVKNRAWEARREADLYSLKVDYNRERFVHLYFGSPFEGFRERVRAELNDVPQQPIYVLGKKSAPRMDLRTGWIDGKVVLNPGRKCHQLIDVLLQDFYRPKRIAGLFSEMFPEEQFDIMSSPHRVHQLISRTRQTLSEAQIPVEIREDAGFYSLTIEGAFSFRVPLDRQRVGIPNLQIDKLRSAFASAPYFSAKDVQASLNLSPATIHRLIHRGIRDGHIVRAGQVGFAHVFKISGALQKNAS